MDAEQLQRELERARQKVAMRRMIADLLRSMPVSDQRDVLLEVLLGLETQPVAVMTRKDAVLTFEPTTTATFFPLTNAARRNLVARVMTVLEHRPRTFEELREQIAPSIPTQLIIQTLKDLEKAMRVHERDGSWYSGAADSDENVPGADEPTVGETIRAILTERAPEGMLASDVMAELKKRRGTEAAVGYSAAARMLKRHELRREPNSNGTVIYYLDNPHRYAKEEGSP